MSPPRSPISPHQLLFRCFSLPSATSHRQNRLQLSGAPRPCLSAPSRRQVSPAAQSLALSALGALLPAVANTSVPVTPLDPTTANNVAAAASSVALAAAISGGSGANSNSTPAQAAAAGAAAQAVAQQALGIVASLATVQASSLQAGQGLNLSTPAVQLAVAVDTPANAAVTRNPITAPGAFSSFDPLPTATLAGLNSSARLHSFHNSPRFSTAQPAVFMPPAAAL